VPHLDLLENRADADLASLYWWRRGAAAADEDTEAAAPLAERLVSLAERAAPTAPAVIDLPGNRMHAKAQARHARKALALREEIAADPDLLAALRHERRNATVILASAMIATAAPAALTVYAATMHQPVALCFALAGTLATSFALYHAVRWFRLMRSAAVPNLLA
jgi:hypothetical protein